jgi:UDP-N-acetylglucosamine 2-epimerase
VKIASIVGARPQFVKAAPVSRALRRRAREVLIHTGQHYDYEMSQVFFDGLDLPVPDHNLCAGSGSHARQTAAMLRGLEPLLQAERPDLALVYGDTNSTLAGALAAAKLGLPVAHVEAGLRCGDRRMPEEQNRVVTDRLSAWLFAPTQAAVANLRREGIEAGVHLTGDVMLDALCEAGAAMDACAERLLAREGVAPGRYYLATIHRAANTDDPARLGGFLRALAALDRPVLLPLHPRTREALGRLAPGVGAEPDGTLQTEGRASAVRLRPPLPYVEMLALERHAAAILTDSGGVQKEAYLLGVPCVTLRDETEWIETVASGWNVLAGCDPDAIRAAARRPTPAAPRPPVYGDGRAAERIAAILCG